MKKIALIGECMIELNGTPFGEMHQTFGGDSLNSAVYLSRATGEDVLVQYVTAMGSDPLSEGIIQRWQLEGINTEMVLKDDLRLPGLYLIQLNDDGERAFLYWRSQSAARFMVQHPRFAQVAEKLGQMDMIYLSGISLAILPEQDRQELLTLLKSLAQKGAKIIFDSNFRPVLWPQNEDWETVRKTYSELLSFCDTALLTFDDEQDIWGDSSTDDALARLATSGVAKVVIKLGAEGCLFRDFSQVENLTISTISVAKVVDTTSAGDSFNAGFLSGYLQELSPEECCIRGNQLAGVVIQNKGAIVPIAATEVITSTFN